MFGKLREYDLVSRFGISRLPSVLTTNPPSGIRSLPVGVLIVRPSVFRHYAQATGDVFCPSICVTITFEYIAGDKPSTSCIAKISNGNNLAGGSAYSRLIFSLPWGQDLVRNESKYP